MMLQLAKLPTATVLLCMLMNARLSWSQSCVVAGYTSCCDDSVDPNNCAGGPVGVCLCDPSCHEFGDCCEDIMEICHPEKDEFYSTLKPLAVFTSEVTYLSATVHWVSAVYTNTTSSNGTGLTYTLILTSSSGVEMSLHADVIVRPANYSRDSEHYSLRLSGLEPATEYRLNLTAATWFGELQFTVAERFITEDPSDLCVGGVQLTLSDPTSLQVSWSPLSLPRGVSVSSHVIRYRESPLGHEEILLVNSSTLNRATIDRLREGVLYSFVVMATITEAGGRGVMTGECGESKVFVPALRLFQLTMVGTFSSHCAHWEVAEELALSAALRIAIVTRLREMLDPDYPTDNVRNDYIMCHSTASSCHDNSDMSQRLTYRATIVSTLEHSTDNLIGSLRTWSRSASELAIPDHMIDHTPLTTPLILVDTGCPLEVRTRSHPLCESSDLLTPSPVTESGCVSVPVFVASLVALFLFLLVVTMVIVVCMLVCSQNKTTKHSVADGVQGTSATPPNIYVHNPNSPDDRATPTQDHTPNTPLTIHTAHNSSKEHAHIEGAGPDNSNHTPFRELAQSRDSVTSTV